MSQPQLVMRRHHLNGLPELNVESPYVLRTYQPGDEVSAAECLARAFDEPWTPTMVMDELAANERTWAMYVVVLGDLVVATTTARQSDEPDLGYVHWVATHPDHTGRRLGYQVSLAVLHEFVRRGATRAILTTDDPRLPAIQTYLNLGFEPDITDASHPERWAKVREALAKGRAPRPRAEVLANYHCVTGEGPLWHPDEQALYWTDIPNGRLFRWDRATGEHAPVYDGPQVGGMTLQDDGSLLLFREKGNIAIWRDGTETEIVELIPEERESRFNDVIADPEGRVFCGTMPGPNGPGRLYRLDTDGTLTLLLTGIGCSNGMGFTPDSKGFYYTDTGKREVYRFDYDRATGAITNQRVFLSIPAGVGYPDGMTVDAEGFVWVAFWDGYRLARYSPDGEDVGQWKFPTKKVSCLAFGGPDYDEIYVTTAGGDNPTENGEDAGALLRLKVPGMRGVPEFRSQVRVSR
jgi:D-xylonolactonase